MIHEQDEPTTWAIDQMKRNGWAPTDGPLAQATHTAVLKLLDEFLKQQHRPETAKATIELFSKLALGHSLDVPEVDEVWVQATRGQIAVEDIIRVHDDAFTGQSGMMMNGRRGKVVAVRRGEIWVVFNDGRLPETPPTGITLDPRYYDKLISRRAR